METSESYFEDMVSSQNESFLQHDLEVDHPIDETLDVDLHHDDSHTAPSPGCFSNRSIYSPSAVASGDADMQVDESLDLDLSTTQETHVVGSLNFDNLLRDATVLVDASALQMPWETDDWKPIFDSNFDPMESWSKTFRKRKLPELLTDPGVDSSGPSTRPAHAPVSSDARRIAVTAQCDMLWTDKRAADLQRALKKWVALVSNWPTHWRCAQEVANCKALDQAYILMSDYLSGKAPATLVKRANSMIYIIDASKRLGYFFPWNEPDFYQLLKTLRSSLVTPSRLKSVVEAVTFCRFSFQISDFQQLVESKRCMGVTNPDPGRKPQQAEPLTVRDVCLLHEIQDSGQVWDRAFAGACLFCIYARARWSDFCHGDTLRLDFSADGRIAYADMEVYIHKTMHSSAKRFKFLDLAASGIGFSGTDWIATWVSVMDNLGIDYEHQKPGKCLMPAPGEDDTPCVRPLDCSEVGTWLRLLLGERAKRTDSRRLISSHSLKATLLSMAAKRGLSLEDRLSMGHHAHPFKMADVYAREAQARTMRLLDRFILEIRSGVFLPDETRAGRFSSQAMIDQVSDVGFENFLEDESERFDVDAAVQQTFQFSYDNLASQAFQEPDSYDTSGTSDSDEESVELQQEKPVFFPPEPPEGFKFVQHKRTKTLHLVDHRFPSSTNCGRMVDSNYHGEAAVRWDSAVCHTCKKKKI